LQRKEFRITIIPLVMIVGSSCTFAKLCMLNEDIRKDKVYLKETFKSLRRFEVWCVCKLLVV